MRRRWAWAAIARCSGWEAEKVFLFNYDHIGTSLASINALSYSTYKDPSSSFPFPSINIQIDQDGGALNPGDFRTLVYEPYHQPGFVDVSGVWEHRDAYNGGAAKWWATGAGSACPQSLPCTWSDMLAAYPSATIFGGFGINAGSGNAGMDGSVDALSIAYGGGSVTYQLRALRDRQFEGTVQERRVDDGETRRRFQLQESGRLRVLREHAELALART